MASMPRPRPPRLHRETNRHGTVVWYVRVGKGSRIRIKATYGTPEFEAAYQDALNGELPTAPGAAAKGTLEWLWNLYRGTKVWTDLSPATRRQRENIMRPVLKSAGQDPLSKVTKRAVEKGVDRRKATPTQAKHFVTTLRRMFEWAIGAELVKVDPTHGIDFKTGKKGKSAGFPVWSEEELLRFERRWPRGTRQRVLFDIYQFTGLRRGDAARVGKQHVRDGVITLATEKTGMPVSIPILPELKATLEAGPTGDLNFMARLDGNPMTKESVGNFFKEACRAAGIPNKSGHGIRKAAATAAADNEATTAQMNSIFGWEGDAMASLYTKSANRKRLAAGAIGKLSRTKTETSIPAPDDEVRERERKG